MASAETVDASLLEPASGSKPSEGLPTWAIVLIVLLIFIMILYLLRAVIVYGIISSMFSQR